MSKCRAVAFFNEDLHYIDPAFTVSGVGNMFFDEGPACTIMIGDRPVGCLGIGTVYKGVGVAWCLMDKNIQAKYRRRIALICKEETEKKINQYGFHRIQADVICEGFEMGHRFVKFMGFKSEGIMKAFGPDKSDYERYALVRC